MYRVRTIFTGVAGTPWYSNLYFDDQAPGGPEGAVAAVAAFWEALELEMYQQIDWTVEGDVPAISPGTGEIENMFSVASISGGGTSNTQPLPWANQGLIRFTTGAYVGGRQIRGRLFVPGATEDDSTNGTPTASYMNTVDAAAEALIADADTELVVYSRRNFIQSPVQAAAVAPYWAVLRSRRD